MPFDRQGEESCVNVWNYTVSSFITLYYFLSKGGSYFSGLRCSTCHSSSPSIRRRHSRYIYPPDIMYAEIRWSYGSKEVTHPLSISIVRKFMSFITLYYFLSKGGGDIISGLRCSTCHSSSPSIRRRHSRYIYPPDITYAEIRRSYGSKEVTYPLSISIVRKFMVIPFTRWFS